MDTQQYEEAVRDYEKVYQTEKTKGVCVSILIVHQNDFMSLKDVPNLTSSVVFFRTQEPVEERSVRAEEKQKKRLL